MYTINLHEAKTHLPKLVDQAAKGESFIIAKAGRPMVMVLPIDTDEAMAVQRLDFMSGEMSIPDDFDRMGEIDIERLFGGDHS